MCISGGGSAPDPVRPPPVPTPPPVDEVVVKTLPQMRKTAKLTAASMRSDLRLPINSATSSSSMQLPI